MNMEAADSYQRRSHFKPAHESHLDLLSGGKLSDVTFVVGPSKERIPCHQLFLAARSPVFEVMFSERWNHEKNKEIQLQDIDPKIFKKFLQFIYTDHIVANMPEALELLKVAHVYDVQLLVSRCEDILLANELTLNDALDVFQVARKYETVQLMDKAGDLMAKSLSKLQNLRSFSRLDKETLMYILQRNDLKMKEVDLFSFVVKWSKNQSDSTVQQRLQDILPLIRFTTMTLEEFTTVVVPTDILSQTTLVEIFTYFVTDAETKKSMAATFKFNTQRRRTADLTHCFDLYSGDLAGKRKRCLQLPKLEDCLQISSRVTGTTSMGINGISVYCPARAASTASRHFSSTFKEFKIVCNVERKIVTSGPHHKNLLSMFPVKAEEGKMTEIKFDNVVPLENNAHYRITVEEIPTTSAQLTVSMEDYYFVKVFGRIRNCYLTLNVINSSVEMEGMRKNEVQQGLGDEYEHPQLICRFGLEEL